MPKLETVAKLSDIAAGRAKEVQAGGKSIAVFNLGGKFYAIDNECTHVGGPLADGEIDGTKVICPWHGAEFDITSGQVLCPPAGGSVSCYKVQVAGDAVQIELP